MIDEEKLRKSLSGRRIGQNVIYLKAVDSTNDYAFGLARKGASEGTVILADEQTRGRGRLQRVWQSPPGRNIYTSIILRPPLKPALAPQITLTAGVAVADLLSQYSVKGVSLKWPNDVQIGDQKVCGILTEMKVLGDRVDFVIVGIGLNVNMQKEDFDAGIRDRATSVREETGSVISRHDLAVQLYHCLERWYKILLDEGFPPVRESWLAFADILGRRIRVDPVKDAQGGEVIGVDADGALLIKNESGIRQRVITGDIIVERD